MPRRRRDSGIQMFLGTNQYGRQSIPGSAPLISDRTVRRLRHGSTAFRHPARNGVYDPVTYYHIVEALLSVKPEIPFKSAEFTDWLNRERDFMSWDATSVGRILNDIHDNLVDLLGDESAFIVFRDWSAKYYETVSNPKGRAALLRLADDLARLAKEVVDQERAGPAVKRTESPLLHCPSIMDPARALDIGDAA
ncbi:MAG TPA: hypothetical protein VLA89_15595 [Gemmatimonadales bacterium]|nr:hypothetical protein [Gemmatimonadales bacterium]